MSRSGFILGWDVGGANIKAARISRGGAGIDPEVVERPYPLWREPERLREVLLAIARELGAADGGDEMAVTMTAELADCFPTKRDGVAAVLAAFEAAFPRTQLRVWGVDGRFRSVDRAHAEHMKVAAANWVATAMIVAETFRDAVLVDVGSTTTDVVPIAGGRVVASGATDTERLAAGELVYTGVLRTPVSAIVRSVPLAGRRCRVAAELFAIAADVYVWLGEISPADYRCETPDGRGPDRQDAGRRLARMVCADLETLGAAAVTAIARHVARAQVAEVRHGLAQVMSRLGDRVPSVGLPAGSGAFLARRALEGTPLAVSDPAEGIGSCAVRIGPAVAVARLASRTPPP